MPFFGKSLARAEAGFHALGEAPKKARRGPLMATRPSCRRNVRPAPVGGVDNEPPTKRGSQALKAFLPGANLPVPPRYRLPRDRPGHAPLASHWLGHNVIARPISPVPLWELDLDL